MVVVEVVALDVVVALEVAVDSFTRRVRVDSLRTGWERCLYYVVCIVFVLFVCIVFVCVCIVLFVLCCLLVDSMKDSAIHRFQQNKLSWIGFGIGLD